MPRASKPRERSSATGFGIVRMSSHADDPELLPIETAPGKVLKVCLR
jgi:hypothetical protein